MPEEKLAEKIAENVVELISDAREVAGLSSNVKSLQNRLAQMSAEFGKLERRIENLERRVENMGGNFKTFAVEADRIISEKTEEMNRENDEMISKLLTEMQDLRDVVIEMKRGRIEGSGKVM